MNYAFNFKAVWSNLDLLLSGLGLGLLLALISIAIGVVIGFFVAFGLLSQNKIVAGASNAYVSLVRNIPLLLIIFFVFFALPQIGIRFDKLTSFVGALSFYAAAYLAEVFRGGLLAVPKGMDEAAKAIGLRPLQIKAYIILPIMLRSVLPTLGNAFISLFKDTSLAAAISVPELTFYARKVNLESFRIIETWMVVSLLYVATAFIMSSILRLLERRLSLAR